MPEPKVSRPRKVFSRGERAPVVVGIGEILWDMLPSGKQLGGAPANFAFHARSLGARSAIVSAVGRDALGREILGALEAAGLETRFISLVDAHPTGTVGVELDIEGVPRFTIADGAAWDFIPSNANLLGLAVAADAVCFGTLAQRSPVSRAMIRAFLEATRPECLRVFDVNLRQSSHSRELLDDFLRKSSVLKVNEEELGVLTRLFSLSGSDTQVLTRLLEAYPLELIALTLGKRGSRLFSLKGESYCPAPAVEVSDTIGAGDAYMAALVMGLLKGKSLVEINDRANRVAAFVCTQPGAWPRIPASLSAWD